MEDHAHKQNNKVLLAPDGIILILDSQRVFQRWKIGAPAIPEIFKTFENMSFEKSTNITEQQNLKKKIKWAEAVLQSCSYKKVFWKYAANVQENTHAKVKSHFGMGVLL